VLYFGASGVQVQKRTKEASTDCRMATVSKFTSTPEYKKRKLAETNDTDSPATILDSSDSSYCVDEDCSLPNSGTVSTPESETKPSVQDETKYIVFRSCLWELFEVCPTCQTRCNIQSTNKGSFVKILQECLNKRCQFCRTWESQPMLHNTPAGNILISAAILFNGASYTKVLRVLDSIGISSISESTYKKQAREYLQPTVYKMWRDKQSELLMRLSAMPGKPEIGADGRADSPGHCAKYGTYTAMELRINKIIDLQLVQSNEVGGSYHMELAGLKRCIEFLQSKKLLPGVLVTDRHMSIQKWVREELPGTVHYYDVWHVAKGLGKKLETIAKLKECELVGRWLRSISNHLYWCAASSANQSGEVIAAKWLSVLRHVQNIHDGHSELFPSCSHGELEQQRKWFLPNTKAFDKLSATVSSKRFVTDMKKLSPLHQTSSVEAFHSLLNQFAPKSAAYSYTGLMVRHMLAAMHYNENSDRNQACTAEGKPRFVLKFPKYKKGSYVVQSVKETPTHNYVSQLMDYLLENTMTDPSEVWELWQQVEVPPPLCSAFERPHIADAISAHTSRFDRSCQPVVDEE